MSIGGKVTIKLDGAKVDKMLKDVAGASVKRAALITQQRARANLQNGGHVVSGKLKDSITVTQMGPYTYHIEPKMFYGGWQEVGVLHPIYPVNAKVLRFKPRGGGGFVFAKMTKGFPAIHYMQRARQALTPADFRK